MTSHSKTTNAKFKTIALKKKNRLLEMQEDDYIPYFVRYSTMLNSIINLLEGIRGFVLQDVKKFWQKSLNAPQKNIGYYKKTLKKEHGLYLQVIKEIEEKVTFIINSCEKLLSNTKENREFYAMRRELLLQAKMLQNINPTKKTKDPEESIVIEPGDSNHSITNFPEILENYKKNLNAIKRQIFELVPLWKKEKELAPEDENGKLPENFYEPLTQEEYERMKNEIFFPEDDDRLGNLKAATKCLFLTVFLISDFSKWVQESTPFWEYFFSLHKTENFEKTLKDFFRSHPINRNKMFSLPMSLISRLILKTHLSNSSHGVTLAPHPGNLLVSDMESEIKGNATTLLHNAQGRQHPIVFIQQIEYFLKAENVLIDKYFIKSTPANSTKKGETQPDTSLHRPPFLRMKESKDITLQKDIHALRESINKILKRK